MAQEPDDLVASGYDAFYESWGQSTTLRAIWREHVTGPDFPEEFAHISFVTLSVLQDLRDALQLAPDGALVGLACGAGGPGLWVAAETGARLRGIDLSPVAVRRATERAGALGLTGRATFAQGSFEATGLESGSVDAVMSIDALQYAPDKSAAIAEIARVLRPGGRLAVITFELDPDRIAGLPVWSDPVPDHRPLLERAGLEVLAYDQLDGWREKVAAAFAEVLAQRDALEAEMGVAAAAALLMEATITVELEPYCGHALVVAERG
jgi:SAM-dependent methyltransferase